MTDAIIEAAARAMCIREFPGKWDIISNESREWYRDLARSSIAAVTPLIRAAALEEAAKVAEREEMWLGDQIATDIRALKEQP